MLEYYLFTFVNRASTVFSSVEIVSNDSVKADDQDYLHVTEQNHIN